MTDLTLPSLLSCFQICLAADHLGKRLAETAQSEEPPKFAQKVIERRQGRQGPAIGTE